jgi:hypothetical protein
MQAQAQAQTQLPLWLVVVLGFAVVLAAVVTQAFNAWLDAKKHRREEEGRKLQWERERTERAEQWAREDRYRWGQDQLKAYGNFVSKCNEFKSLTSGYVLYAANGVRPELIAALRQSHNALGDAVAQLSLLAPAPLAEKAKKLLGSSVVFVFQASGEVAATQNEVIERVPGLHTAMDELVQDIREHLRIDTDHGTESEQSN